MKSFRDNSISARVLICVRQPLFAVSSDGARWRSRPVAPLYGIAAAHPSAVLAFAVVRQIFRTSDPHGAGRVARHDRKLISFFGNRGRYRKQCQQGECDLDYRHATARSSRLLSPMQGWYKSRPLNLSIRAGRLAALGIRLWSPHSPPKFCYRFVTVFGILRCDWRRKWGRVC
jgi:hypothetical protein